MSVVTARSRVNVGAGSNKVRKRVAQLAPSFSGYEDFVVAYNAARQAAITVFGPRWDLHPQAYIWARIPVEWASQDVAGRTLPLSLPPRLGPPQFVSWDALPKLDRLPDEIIGKRRSRAPRDRKLPIARFWSNGELPVGPEYEAGPPAARSSRPRLVHSAEPEKPRRPSGVNLHSGYEAADGGFYVEPRWLVDALLDIEAFEGGIHDPFCGGGNIVGACLARGLAATGSDRYDRGFGERRDAFDITEPCGNLLSNPPFDRIEVAARHFLPLVQRKLVLLARLNVLEGQTRQALFRESPPARVWVSSRRASIPPGDLAHPRDQFGAMVPPPATGGSTAYCFVVWDRDHAGSTVLGWF
jgi:hypothetical protein